jgi:hypothetical protein
MNKNLDQEIEDLKKHTKEKLEDELNYIQKDYKKQIADLRKERDETIRNKKIEINEQIRNDIIYVESCFLKEDESNMILEDRIRNAIARQNDKYGYDHALKLDKIYDNLYQNGTDQDMERFYDAIKEIKYKEHD